MDKNDLRIGFSFAKISSREFGKTTQAEAGAEESTEGVCLLCKGAGSATSLCGLRAASPYRVKGETPWQVEGGSPAQ